MRVFSAYWSSSDFKIEFLEFVLYPLQYAITLISLVNEEDRCDRFFLPFVCTVIKHIVFCRNCKLVTASLQENLDFGYLCWCLLIKSGPSHHNVWLTNRKGKIPRYAISSGFAWFPMWRHCLMSHVEWMWLTLFATNIFHFTVGLRSHYKTIMKSVQ